MDRHLQPALRPVVIWLLVGCTMIACMVAIGGITRLTDSGLSITEWKPISGALPPLNDAQWQDEFDAYKRIPEYTLVNPDMDLHGFKRIYFWEYVHRNWGRLMGFVFLVPFVIFMRKGLLKGWMMKRSLAILVGGGLVGALGWFMVKSGLSENPDVSHYRLAIHLCAAFTVFSLVLWTVLDLRLEPRSFRSDGTPEGHWSRLLLALLATQIVWGAFTAGLDAGTVYNTWPSMNGEFLPENVTAFGSLRENFVEHKDGVQFIHRNLAWVVAIGTVLFAFRSGGSSATRPLRWWLVAVVLLQFSLGVVTLLSQVNTVVAVLHQFGALLLLVVILMATHATGRQRSQA